MNLRRILSQAALIIGTLVFALGLQAYAQTYTAPTQGPTGGNAQAPLDTGAAINFKAGELVTNMSSNGQLGSALDGLVAGGNIVATGDVCSQSSGKCLNSLGGGITGVTAGTGLTGGGTSGNVTLNVKTTAVYDCSVVSGYQCLDRANSCIPGLSLESSCVEYYLKIGLNPGSPSGCYGYSHQCRFVGYLVEP